MITTVTPPVREVLLDCVRTATAAPSLHNSQPWQFRIQGGRVDVYIDAARRLPVLDPDGREQLISVGAALFTLRLALRGSGYRSDYMLFPEPGEPDLVARLTATSPSPVTPAAEALAAAVIGNLRGNPRLQPWGGNGFPAEQDRESRFAATADPASHPWGASEQKC